MKKVKAPYVGIRPFEKEDWPIFFGRESLSNELLYKLETNRFVAVVGSMPYPGVAAGVVLRQNPQAGFAIAPGEPISIEVSR